MVMFFMAKASSYCCRETSYVIGLMETVLWLPFQLVLPSCKMCKTTYKLSDHK